MTPPGPAAIVLAGGQSRRFGSDKLRALVDGQPLLERAVTGLPVDAQVFLVGPEVRGGPAAALVAGLAAALASDASLFVVLPGDAPRAGHLAARMLDRLAERPSAGGLVAVDAAGRRQPLQLALRRGPAQLLVDGAGPGAGVNESVRALIASLHLDECAAEAYELFDVDTPEQLSAWERRSAPLPE